jgi:penicillin-binding protein 1A
MAPHLPAAVIAIEDRRFLDHPGLDLRGMLRALVRNLLAGRVVEGGSTITQQLAKLAFLAPERTFARKLREAVLALWLEARLDKTEILEAYLNRVYLGGGSWGVDGAARHYFGRSAREVGLAEAAMLAGLLRAPSRLAPTRDLEAARARASVVLDAMVGAGLATPDEAARARAQPASLAARGGHGHHADWVAREAGRHAAGHADVTVRTGFDGRLQALAERAVAAALDGTPHEAAVVVMTPDGLVRALVGGRDYRASPFDRATQARRQPGSAFKTFVYLAALEAGMGPDDVVSAAPITIGDWRPRNLDGEYPERVTLEEAFARSINTAAVRLAESVGRERVIAVGRRLGLTGDLPPHASLALGAGEVSLLELTAAYAAIAAGGRLVWPEGLEEVRAGGSILYRRRVADDRVLDGRVVRDIRRLLEAVVQGGTGRAADPGIPAAAKTGTTSDYRDAWLVGFAGDLVVGVWVGNDDGSPMPGVTGGGPPSRIFRDIVRGARAEGLAAPAARPGLDVL